MLLPALLGVALSCGVAQRPSIKVVDPRLQSEGQRFERERRKGGFAVGPYEVHDIGMRSEAPDSDGLLAREGVGRPVTQHRAGLMLDAPNGGRAWTTACTLQRRAPVGADLRAVLDENGDEIAVDCIVKTPGLPPWTFTARAVLSSNFVGQLVAEGDEEDRGGTVEVLTRVMHLQRIQRILPVPVAQLRRDERAVVSVLLGRPETAWVAKDLDPELTEATLALLLTLRFLPWDLAQ